MKKLLTAGLALAFIAASFGVAAAQPSAIEPAPEHGMPAAPDIDVGVLEDANSDRTWMSPTALTPPAGTWSFHDHQLFFVGLGYSPTDNASVSLSTMIPITSDFPLILFGTGKVQVARFGRVRLAGHAMLAYLGTESFGVSGAMVGGAATYCLDDGCHSLINGYVGAGFALENVSQTSAPMVINVAWVQRMSRRMKLVLEVDTGAIIGEINEVANGFLGWYGLRFTSREIAVDVGFVRPFGEGVEMDVFPMGFPWLNFTYRSL